MGKGLRVKVVVIVIVIVDVTNNSSTRQLNNQLNNLSFVFFLLYEFLYDLHGVVLHL